MVFKTILYGSWKKEIRALLNKRLDLKDRLRYHNNKIEHHKVKIREIEIDKLIEVEKQLKEFLEKAGNKV